MSHHHHDHDPLGGGPSEHIAAMRRAVQGRVDGRPGQGLRNPNDPASFTSPNGNSVDRGKLVLFSYTPELPPAGYIGFPPGVRPTVFVAGQKFREFVRQRQTGWPVATPTPEPFSVNPIDGFRGKVPDPVLTANGLPRETYPASSAV